MTAWGPRIPIGTDTRPPLEAHLQLPVLPFPALGCDHSRTSRLSTALKAVPVLGFSFHVPLPITWRGRDVGYTGMAPRAGWPGVNGSDPGHLLLPEGIFLKMSRDVGHECWTVYRVWNTSHCRVSGNQSPDNWEHSKRTWWTVNHLLPSEWQLGSCWKVGAWLHGFQVLLGSDITSWDCPLPHIPSPNKRYT